MDRWKYIDVLHREHVLCNPLSLAKLDEIVELLRLAPGARILDLGCGKGEPLCRMVERWDATAIGVDLSPYSARLALDRAKERGLEDKIEIREQNGADFTADPASFDVVSCMGASWIFGGLSGTLAALARWTRPGGTVVMGEPFWKREPSAEHLEATGHKRDSFLDHHGNVQSGTQHGLAYLHAVVSSEDDWDRYEGYHYYSAENWAAQNPDDPDVENILSLARRYADDSYLRWGREELGWAVYLYRKLG